MLAALVSPVASPLLTPPVDAPLPGRPGSLWQSAASSRPHGRGRVLEAPMLLVSGPVWLLSSATSVRTDPCTQAPRFPYSSGLCFLGRLGLLHSLTGQVLQPQPNMAHSFPIRAD